MDQQKTTHGAASQASKNRPINNPISAAVAAIAQPLFNRSGNGQQLHKSPGHGHTLISSSSPGSILALTKEHVKNPGASHALIQGTDHSGGMLSMSDHDKAMVNQVLKKHDPDGREFDVRALFKLVEDILNLANKDVDDVNIEATRAQIAEKGQQHNFIPMPETHTIGGIACQLSCKSLGGSDAHATTIEIFNQLSSYTWHAKLVLSLSAFVLNYGEFSLLAKIYSRNELANSMAILRQLPSILKETTQQPWFKKLKNLIHTMREVTRLVVEISELPSKYVALDSPKFATDREHIATAVYWTIRSMVACAHQITCLTMSHELEVLNTGLGEFSSLGRKLKTIQEHLRQQLDTLIELIEQMKAEETYQNLVTLFDPNVKHTDNMEGLKTLIYTEGDNLPLFDGAKKTQVRLNVLRNKEVLLLISSLEFPSHELTILEQIYNNSERPESQYKIVWIPIVDNDDMDSKFKILRSEMPWYSVDDLSLIEKPAIRYIKEHWHFKTKTILVVLDPNGNVVSPNAIHMMWIWGIDAFPFTMEKEEALWRGEKWTIELLVGRNIPAPKILNWIKEGKYIFLYGEDDVESARKFANAARRVEADGISIEMVFVGKSNKTEKVTKVTQNISDEKNLGYALEDKAMVWFWNRIESMLLSKIQLGRADDKDTVTQQIKKLVSYDNHGAWAVFSKGSDIVVNDHFSTVFTTLDRYEEWKPDVRDKKDFDLVFQKFHGKLRQSVDHQCFRIDFPTAKKVPASMTCPDCHRFMESYASFICCHGKH